tara:strand:+ start:751 stop:2019 length:1269 start_codon:yes stop_codon:yes gene_type:complete
MKVVNKSQKRKEKRLKEKKMKLVKQELAKIEDAKRVAKHISNEDVVKKRQVQESYKSNTISSLNLVADNNGCGYYRIIWPMELLATNANLKVLNSFVHITDFGVLKHMNSIRFQRQSDTTHCRMLDYYLQERERLGYKYRIQYEIDDLLPEIDPSNKIAYDYFKDKVKYNIECMNKVDAITVSTNVLKDVYSNKYDIDAEKITVIENTLPRFLYNFNRRISKQDFTNRKPRVMWSGSGSHVGENGDLDFIIPLVEKTLDKYNWVFQGTIPNSLKKYIDDGKVEFHGWQTTYNLPSFQMNVCKPDLFIGMLKPSLFNSSKSNLKLLESSALGVPFVGTSFDKDKSYQYDSRFTNKSPYDDTCATTIANGDVDEWISKIDELLNDDNLYMSKVNEQYDMLQDKWMECPAVLEKWYNSIMLGKKS